MLQCAPTSQSHRWWSQGCGEGICCEGTPGQRCRKQTACPPEGRRGWKVGGLNSGPDDQELSKEWGRGF